jgi:serine acetyltransferase
MNPILQDWSANQGNPKGRFVLVFFRLCQVIRRLPAPFWYLGIPILAFYVVTVIWVMGIELDYRTEVGPGLRLYHGVGLVVHQDVKIGARCMLRHGTTIGLKGGKQRCPVLEDDVVVGASAVLLGPITIGKGAVIGAAAVVIDDVPAGAVVAGNPARIIRQSAS